MTVIEIKNHKAFKHGVIAYVSVYNPNAKSGQVSFATSPDLKKAKEFVNDIDGKEIKKAFKYTQNQFNDASVNIVTFNKNN